jgi:hypothetical protein
MRVLSLGAGVQSSALALMIAKGRVPMVDCAIFADTQGEPAETYRWLDWLEMQLPFPVHRVTAGNMRADIMADATKEVRYLLPTFTADGGMGKRQCTNHYKLIPIRRKVRELGATADKPTIQLIGISYDEAWRMKPSYNRHTIHTWPLVEMEWSRWHCIEFMMEGWGRVPPKSACTYCPYGDNERLRRLPPAEFADVVELDDFIRDRGGTPGVAQYLRSERKPLREIDLTASGQTEMFVNECEGMCGV